MTREITLGRTPDGTRVTVEITISPVDNPQNFRTVTHEPLPAGAVRLSIVGNEYQGRQRDPISCGQILDTARTVVPSAQWSAEDLSRLCEIWERWHLNDMRAGCAHMLLIPGESYDARKHITCPVARRVYRDGKPVSPALPDDNAAFAWLLRHQSMSTDWAIKHEGYGIRPGYRYGEAWLYEPLPADVLADVERFAQVTA